jgi:hypothetical protein
MLDQLKMLGSLMKNVSALKERVPQIKAELERRTVEGESGGGAVRVSMNGKFRVVRLHIEAPLMAGLAGGDKLAVEQLIVAAANDAVEKVQRLIAQEMKNAAGGLDIPGLENMLN